MTHTTTTATEWVCVDCHLSVAGYGPEETGHAMPEPFSGDPSITDVTNGSDPGECEHHDGRSWDEWSDADHDAHSEHDHDSFSLTPCAGCGSSLAGDRYAVTVEYVEWLEPFTPDTAYRWHAVTS